MDALKTLIDRAAITDIVNRWGLCRDDGRWDELRSFYTPSGTMHTTWFVGSATEFIDRSIESAKKGARGQHFIGAATIDIVGDKAIAETRMVLLLRAVVHDVEVDVTCHGRFHDQFVRNPVGWQILKRVPIYEKDRIDPLDPVARLELDKAVLARHPEGYRHIAYVQSSSGASITPGLPTPKSEALAALYAEARAWLRA